MRKRPDKYTEPPYYVCKGGPLDELPLKMGDPETLPEKFGLEKRSDGTYHRHFDGEFYTYVWEAA